MRSLQHIARWATFAGFVLILLVSGRASAQTVQATTDEAATGEERAALVARLTSSEASTFDKAKACQRLAVVGDEQAVPALAALLDDERLACYARCALEAIPTEAADDALLESLSRLEGERKIGVLGSLAKRRTAKAVLAIVALSADDDPAVAEAAVRALGYMGAARDLEKALFEVEPKLRPAVGNAYLIAIQHLLAEGHKEEVATLCRVVRQADLPEHIVLAATYQLILAEAPEGLVLLKKYLASEDDAHFRMALQAARQLGGNSELSDILTEYLRRVSPQRQALLLIALREIGDRKAVPAIIAASKHGSREVRIQAIRGLARWGDTLAMQVLVEAAMEADQAIATAARETLSTLRSDAVDAVIVDLINTRTDQARLMAIEMARQRNVTEAVEELLSLTNDDSKATRLAAIGALGATTQYTHFTRFLMLAVGAVGTDDFPAFRSAFAAACVRMPQEPAAKRLVAAMADQPTVTCVFLLEQLATIGGTTALEAVVAAARDEEEDALQDTATRLLGQWKTADAAPAMLDLAKTLEDEKYRVRALRGYVRIARQLNMTAQQRVEVCRNTLAIASRTQDKLLVFEVLRRYPTEDGLKLAASLLGETEFQDRACSTIVEMAGPVAVQAPESSEKALLRVLDIVDDPILRREADQQLANARELARQRREEGEFRSLFDGSTFNGWEGPTNVFRVEDGAIIGGNLDKPIGSGNDFLCTTEEFGDFELRLQFKLSGDHANGGVNVRSKRNSASGVASGYQADLGKNWWGCLYDEARRNRVLASSIVEPRAKPVRIDEWNDYRIRCVGNRIQLWINGLQTVDFTEREANIPPRGIIALQVQAGRPSQAAYRNIRVRMLSDEER